MVWFIPTGSDPWMLAGQITVIVLVIALIIWAVIRERKKKKEHIKKLKKLGFKV